MEKEFGVYIKKIVKKLTCSDVEKSDIAAEIQDHLSLLKNEFIEKGYSETDAVKFAIATFGNENKISSELQNSMTPSLRYMKWFVTILFSVLTALMIQKGINLWEMGSNVDGAGIGVHFLFLEINDTVPEQSIPNYAIGFFVASVITALVPIAVLGKKVLKLK